jgi:dTDP-glucose pyrophosphorylase
MSDKISKHTLPQTATVQETLIKLNTLAENAIVFIVNDRNQLVGSLTDGDLRRGFIKGLGFDTPIAEFIQENPSFVFVHENSIAKLELYQSKNLKIIPVLNKENQIVDIIIFSQTSTIIPADAVLMAGGKGVRLKPLTDTTPKPMLKVGEKPIIEYNIDRLIQVGIKNFNLSVNYLAEQLENYFKDGEHKNVSIKYVKEDKPLGTIGSILLIESFENDDIIVMNSDLLTNIDFVDFYKLFKESEADMAVAATSYHVDIPYAVMEVNKTNQVSSLKEKPRYTYFSNAGIYILKKKLLKLIPENTFFDITDLMNKILELDFKLVTYPINGYWLDIGKHEDFIKAQEDVKHIKF